jgi:hypothetical protein
MTSEIEREREGERERERKDRIHLLNLSAAVLIARKNVLDCLYAGFMC